MQPGIRSRLLRIEPAPGVWDYDGGDSGGRTMSISVFQWRESAARVVRGRAVRHFRGITKNQARLEERAEILCQELERNPNLALCSDFHVRIETARDTTTPSQVLAELGRDGEARVRIEVAKHRNTDSFVLSHLSSDPDDNVRASAAGNPNTPAEVASTLLSDTIGTVASAARRSIVFRNALRTDDTQCTHRI